MITSIYSTPEFEEKYTYTGSDLGVSLQNGKTGFRLWAPTAQKATVNLYCSGDPAAHDLVAQLPMTQSCNGTWIAKEKQDLHGLYYTYTVIHNGQAIEAIDPYARSSGANGLRGMVLDLKKTDPAGWDQDRFPHADLSITDAIIYELHVRDLSMDANSGITHKGKFLGLTESGTVTPGGVSTGLDHIKNLGVTHIHLLPSYDYGSVDESKPDVPQFNWGYDPVNYNIPEGSYATDPFHGEVRVREMKQMIKTLHDNGIGVIMDVVYNHVFKTEQFCFNRIVPGYFSRQDEKGRLSNGSCCGNDTASERSMVRKFIVDSVCYWADEYHIDGFRFDLVGLIDVQTIREVMTQVHKKHPHVIFYGEGWTMNTSPTKPGVALATQENAFALPGFAFFCDRTRDALKGSVFSSRDRGYISGESHMTAAIADCFCCRQGWTDEPTQVINYASCHDNLTLFDKIVVSTYGASRSEQIAMNNLGAAIYLLSQGTPLFQAGEEMLRSKPRADGSFESNSYNSPDSVNALKWGDLEKVEYQRVVNYYRGLIAFRKAHSVLRLPTGEEIARRIRLVPGTKGNVLVFNLRSSDGKDLLIAFNPTRHFISIPLPAGTWDVCIHGNRAGTKPLGQAEGTLSVAPISAAALVLQSVNTRK